MVANWTDLRRRLRSAAMLAVAAPPLLIVFVSWWFTAPIEPSQPGYEPTSIRKLSPEPDSAIKSDKSEPLAEWPEHSWEGREAKLYLLRFMERAVDRLDQVSGYTATLRRQERINGELGPEQRLSIKILHNPFAVYLRFEAPKAGKEVLYQEGRFDGHLIAHNGDWTRRLIPRLKLDPHGPIALAENRHPITEIGLAHLARRLLHFRHLDLDDPIAETTLDRWTDEEGNLWYRSLHFHTEYSADRPFQRVEVRYSPELLIPLHIISHDWPEPGQVGEEPQLAERYHYEDVVLDASLSLSDFDPANPEYEFQRY